MKKQKVFQLPKEHQTSLVEILTQKGLGRMNRIRRFQEEKRIQEAVEESFTERAMRLTRHFMNEHRRPEIQSRWDARKMSRALPVSEGKTKKERF